MVVAHIALDGGTVEFEGPEGVLEESASSHTTFRFGSDHVQEFASGPRGWGEAVAREVAGIAVLDEQYSFQGGELLVGWTEDIDPTAPADHRLLGTARAGVWTAERFSVYTVLYGGNTEDLISLMSLLDFSVVEHGPMLAPASRDVTVERPATVTKEIPGVGVVEVRELTHQVARLLPDWSGLPVPGGELFADDHGTDPGQYVLAGDTSYSTIVSLEPLPQEAFVAALGSLSVTWRAH